MKSILGVRGFCEKINAKPKREYVNTKPLTHERVLVFDTETSYDEFQNLKFGSFLIVQNNIEVFRGIFYEKNNISNKEEAILKEFCEQDKIKLYLKDEFVKEIFYPELLGQKTLCIGFNLPFDLSRLGINFSEGRYKNRKKFSIPITDDKRFPRIIIQHLDSTKSFIHIGKNPFGKSFKGYFLDLKTISSVFSDNKSISLKKAGEFFDCPVIKEEAEEHGKITPDYIRYNLKDVDTTFEIYKKALEYYDFYNIKIPITQIYSSASLGKQALRDMGVQPLHKINSDLDSMIKGNLMSAYFGGRCESKVRKEPVLVDVLDFLSMYPSLTIMMNLWNFVIAKEIKKEIVTDEIISFLEKVKLEDLNNPKLWEGFNVLVELTPDNDILPVRSNYLEDSTIYNLGINYLKTKDSLFYALPDVISSVLLTGKIPKIKRAIRFIPIGKQDSLKEINILGIKIDPRKDNFIKKLIEIRYGIKCKMKLEVKGSKAYNRLDSQQRALKILANSSTYGIFIEMNQDEKESNFQVYSKDSFSVRQKMETVGNFFNPLIAVMQISGARLLLTMAEYFISKKGGTHYYMDTDSCFVQPEFSEDLRDFFAPLNPYSFDADFFEIEKERLLFYSISSKRYVLYNMRNGLPEIYEHKLHGLGHLLNPYKGNKDWQKNIWEDILKLNYGIITEEDILEKYLESRAISKLTVSTPSMYKLFKKYNEDKPLSKQIKPFNFVIIGQGTNKNIKPIAPRKGYPQEAIYRPFINYKTGEIMQGEEYWLSLSDTILRYANHPESKFKNGKESGVMRRRFLCDGTLRTIGKEIRNLESQSLKVDLINEFMSEEKKREMILAMTPEEAREKGVLHRSSLIRLKAKIRNQEEIDWKKGIAGRLV